MARPNCPDCSGTGWIEINDNHLAVCPTCCEHDKGYSPIPKGSKDAGKFMCAAGCGRVVDKVNAIG